MQIDRNGPLCLAALLASALATHGVATVPQYTDLQLQVRSNITDGFNLPAGSSFNSGTPDLNDNGAVSIRLLVVGDTGNAGIWAGSGGVGTTVYQLPAGPLAGDVSINGLSDIVFERFDLFTEGIYKYTARDGMTSLAVPPAPYSTISSPRLNDAGVIAFRGKIGSGQMFVADDGRGQVTYVAETVVDNESPFAFLFTPSFNNAGQIAGKARVGGTSGSQPDEIRVWEPDGSSVLIAVDDDGDPFSPYVGFDNSVDVNDQGAVAFIATLDGGDRGVFYSDGVTTVTIATESTTEVGDIEFFHPAVNNDGLVAFRGKDDDGLRAVWAGDGQTLTVVVREHDLLPSDLGEARVDQESTSSPVFGGSPAINNNGDVAFACGLTPPDDDQIEWGSGLYIALAGGTQLPGDANGDGVVNVEDLLLVITSWGNPGGMADLNRDLIVDVLDLVLVLTNWS